MASSTATLSLCSSFTTHCRLSPSSTQPSLAVSKPFCPFKSNFGSFSFHTSSTKPAFLPIPKFAQVDAPVIEAETGEPASEATEIVKTPEEVPKREEIFAVVMVGSRQYIVFPGRFIYTQRLKGANVNDKIILNKVLLVGTRTETYIGKPVVTNASVHAVVEEQCLDKKVIVFKYKKKKHYRRNIGHRQPITRIRITAITGYQDYPAVTLEQ